MEVPPPESKLSLGLNIEKIIADLDVKICAEMNAWPSMIGTVTAPAPTPTLTLEKWDAMCREFGIGERVVPSGVPMNFQATLTPDGQAWAAGLRIIEVQPSPIYSQARAHRRRRINKKWLKRYGVKQTGWNYYLGDQLLVDEKRNVAYCHPETAQRLRYELAKPRVTCQNCKHSWIVASERAAQSQFSMLRSIGRESFMDSVDPGDGPAGGEHECPKCGAVNSVCRLMGGGWNTILISVPDNKVNKYNLSFGIWEKK